MPTFYDKFFKPSKRKGMIRSKRTEWLNEEHVKEYVNEFEELPKLKDAVKLKDAEDYIIRQMFKRKKKSLAKQKVHKKEDK